MAGKNARDPRNNTGIVYCSDVQVKFARKNIKVLIIYSKKSNAYLISPHDRCSKYWMTLGRSDSLACDKILILRRFEVITSFRYGCILNERKKFRPFFNCLNVDLFSDSVESWIKCFVKSGL